MSLNPIRRHAARLWSSLNISHDLSLIERAWDAEIGGLTSMAHLVALERDALVVEATSSPAMQELSLRRKELVRRLNRHFPHPLFRQLTIRMAQTDPYGN